MGSNVGDRRAQLKEAKARLGALGRVTAESSIYETEPVEYTQQPWFLNCAVAIETRRSPLELMAAILEIAQEKGRNRAIPKGPRSIDIDILFFDRIVVKSENLTIPHPALHKRRFVLEPLAEIAAEFRHPVLKRTIRELRDALPAGQVVRKLIP
ncbi:MAG: 2-amino-4-hydroxy-6-hydroxymethyldihydropteridine diphosphokinase [Candidatus Sulfotelmatobacter sp.]